MFFANSLKHQLRWGILASFICLGCVISTIFFSVYYIDYFDEFKEELIEEKNELVLFGLEKEKGQQFPILHEELTEIYTIHHISARAFFETNQDILLFKTGIFINYTIPISNITSSKPTFNTITYGDDSYIQYLYPFFRNNGCYYLEFLAPKPRLLDVLQPLLFPFLITFLTFILIVFPLSFWFSNRIIYPLYIIKEQLNSLHSNNLDIPLLPYQNHDEIYELIQSIEKVKHRFHAIFQSLLSNSSLLSHEIRNYLVVLQTKIDIYVPSTENKEELHHIIQTTSECIDTLKCIYLIDDHRYPFEFSVFKLSFALKKVISQFKEPHRIKIQKFDTLPIETDLLLFQYILKNCLENALIHSKDDCNISLKEHNLYITNTCSIIQFQRLQTHLTQANEDLVKPKSSLGSLIIVKLSNALTISYTISFDETTHTLVQSLDLSNLT